MKPKGSCIIGPTKAAYWRWQQCLETRSTFKIPYGPSNLCQWRQNPPFCSNQKPGIHSWLFFCTFSYLHTQNLTHQKVLSPKYILNLSTVLSLHCHYPVPNHHHFSPGILQYFSWLIHSGFPLTHSPTEHPECSFKNQIRPFILLLENPPMPATALRIKSASSPSII